MIYYIMIDIDFGLHLRLHLAPIQEHNTCTDLSDFTEQPRQHPCFHGHDESIMIHISSTGGGIACDPGTAWHVLAIVHPQSVLVQRGFAIAKPC